MVIELIEIVVKEIEWVDYKMFCMVRGLEFECVVVEYLIYKCDLLVVFGDYVIMDVGIGCVYIVLGYGEDDFIVG